MTLLVHAGSFGFVSNRILTTVAVLLIGWTTTLQAQTSSSGDRPAPGTYSEDQATRGEVVYKATCASCHELSFHTDEQFRFNWFGRTVYDLFKILKTTMPEDNIGGLTDDEYTRVIAYILKLNGFAPGTDSLKADSLEMKRIRISAAVDSTKPKRR